MIADVEDVGLAAARSRGADAEGVVLPAGAAIGPLVDEGHLLEGLDLALSIGVAAHVEVLLEHRLVAVEDGYPGGDPRGALAGRRVGVPRQEDVGRGQVGGQIAGVADGPNRVVSMVDVGREDRVWPGDLHEPLVDQGEGGFDDHRDAELTAESPQAGRRDRGALGVDLDGGGLFRHAIHPVRLSAAGAAGGR